MGLQHLMQSMVPGAAKGDKKFGQQAERKVTGRKRLKRDTEREKEKECYKKK